MNREQRRKNKKIQHIIDNIEEIKENTKKTTMHTLIDVYGTSVAMVLHDKFGFGEVRVKRAMNMIYEQFDSINKGLVSLEDLQETLLKECKYRIGGEVDDKSNSND